MQVCFRDNILGDSAQRGDRKIANATHKPKCAICGDYQREDQPEIHEKAENNSEMHRQDHGERIPTEEAGILASLHHCASDLENAGEHVRERK